MKGIDPCRLNASDMFIAGWEQGMMLMVMLGGVVQSHAALMLPEF